MRRELGVVLLFAATHATCFIELSDTLASGTELVFVLFVQEAPPVNAASLRDDADAGESSVTICVVCVIAFALCRVCSFATWQAPRRLVRNNTSSAARSRSPHNARSHATAWRAKKDHRGVFFGSYAARRGIASCVCQSGQVKDAARRCPWRAYSDLCRMLVPRRLVLRLPTNLVPATTKWL